jgi:hypothetical protein
VKAKTSETILVVTAKLPYVFPRHIEPFRFKTVISFGGDDISPIKCLKPKGQKMQGKDIGEIKVGAHGEVAGRTALILTSLWRVTLTSILTSPLAHSWSLATTALGWPFWLGQRILKSRELY